MKKKKGEREREEREGETRAGADRGDDRGAGRPRSAVARADKATGKGGRGLEIGRLEPRKIPEIRIQGLRRILSLTMKIFGKKYFSA